MCQSKEHFEENAEDTSHTTLDYIDNIIVTGNPFAEPSNEYYALLCLRSGLELLYRQMINYEKLALVQIDPKKQFYCIGNYPDLKGIPYQLLTCFFHWYSISACQYVRTVGAIAYRQDPDKPTPYNYVKSVIPEVLTFRDKVAAHFAWATNNSEDNEAEKLASIIPQVAFSIDSFQVQTLIVNIRVNGKSSSSKEIQPWGITKIHRRLQERYWPEDIKK